MIKFKFQAIALIFLFSPFISFSQIELTSGKYIYENSHFNQSIDLKSNGKFDYRYSGHFLLILISGNWQIRGSDLILDSSPHKDKMLCYEGFKKKAKNSLFEVRAKSDNRPIYYHLYLITRSSDTLEYRDQWEKTVVKEKEIKAFYLFNTLGVKSPTYIIKGGNTNTFHILFETGRTLDNEDWKITGSGLIPRDNAGEYEKFTLRKESAH